MSILLVPKPARKTKKRNPNYLVLTNGGTFNQERTQKLMTIMMTTTTTMAQVMTKMTN